MSAYRDYVKEKFGDIDQMFIKERTELDDVIKDLDQKLIDVLKRQEADYLKGYSIYVKQKQKDLKDIITKMSANNSDNDQKDKKIFLLQKQLDELNKDRVKMETEKQELQERVKHWMARAQGFEQDMHSL